jgi:hypothetical protein
MGNYFAVDLGASNGRIKVKEVAELIILSSLLTAIFNGTN